MQFSSALKRTMYDFKNSFFPNFLLFHRAKYIFSKDMFCLYHFRAKFTVCLGNTVFSKNFVKSYQNCFGFFIMNVELVDEASESELVINDNWLVLFELIWDSDEIDSLQERLDSRVLDLVFSFCIWMRPVKWKNWAILNQSRLGKNNLVKR